MSTVPKIPLGFHMFPHVKSLNIHIPTMYVPANKEHHNSFENIQRF